MNPETVNAIKDALAPIAAKIGQGAEYGWDVVVRQQYINGVVSLMWASLSFLFLVSFAIFVFWAVKTHKDDDSSTGQFLATCIVVGIIVSVFAIIGLLLNLGDGIQHLLNPAYYALDFFIHLGTSTK